MHTILLYVKKVKVAQLRKEVLLSSTMCTEEYQFAIAKHNTTVHMDNMTQTSGQFNIYVHMPYMQALTVSLVQDYTTV